MTSTILRAINLSDANENTLPAYERRNCIIMVKSSIEEYTQKFDPAKHKEKTNEFHEMLENVKSLDKNLEIQQMQEDLDKYSTLLQNSKGPAKVENAKEIANIIGNLLKEDLKPEERTELMHTKKTMEEYINKKKKA